MATEIAQPFYDKFRKHLETGIKWEHMNFTDEQKKRIEVCLDAYKRFASDPFMDLPAYIRNRWERSYSELKNDMKVVDFIASFYDEGQRNLTKMQVRHSSRILMKNGADSGDLKSVKEGAALAMKLERLDQPDTPEDIDGNRAKMAIVFVSDASKKYPGKVSHDTEEMKRLRKKYGAKQDPWQEMVENGNGVYVPAKRKAKEEPDEEEEQADSYRENEEDMED